MNNLELHASFQAEEEALQQAFKNHGLLKDDLDQERPQDVTEIKHDAFRLPDDVLCEKLKAYIEAGADVDAGATDNRSSAFYDCFWYGKMASMRLLLRAGAQTHWTADQVSLALGNVPATPQTGTADPFCVACRLGNFDAARAYRLKFDAGRNKSSDAVMAAVQARAADIVKWLMDLGFDPNAEDEIKVAALERAVDNDDIATAKVLLEAGAAPLGSQEKDYTSLAEKTVSNEMRVLFVKHGVNPAQFDYGPCLENLKFSTLPEIALTKSDFKAHRTNRAGTSNPERFLPAFWSEQMRESRYSHLKSLGASPDRNKPIWSFSRFGRSATALPDGRLVFIAGEHEDHYDADFCIYADVTVLGTDGSVDHFIYPADVFPPTDFHSATLQGQHIWLIGCLGYHERRKENHTQVLCLSTADFSISSAATTGETPGWIFGHRATLTEQGIVITGGKTDPEYEDNESTYLLNLKTLVWTKIS